jgi:hypothetical protein
MSENLEYIGKWMIRFGKYKDTAFGVILETPEGRDYCRWMLDKNVLRNDKVVMYLRHKLTSS